MSAAVLGAQVRAAPLSCCPTWVASGTAPQGAVSSPGAASSMGSVPGRRGRCFVPAVSSRTRLECASLPLSFPQACSIKDPNSGYVFDLNPLNNSQGYVALGIGKMFLVRLAGCTFDLPWKDGRRHGVHPHPVTGEAGALRSCPGHGWQPSRRRRQEVQM